MSMTLACVFTKGAAQQVDQDPIKNIDTIRMERIKGVWEWKDGRTSFTVVFKRKKMNTTSFLYGFYKFVKDGKVVIDKTAQINPRQDPGLVGILFRNKSEVSIIFTDYTRKNLRKDGTLTFNQNNPKTAILKLPAGGNVHIANLAVRDYPDVLPDGMEITLTKIQ